MPTHPAVTRQQSRIVSSGEQITAPAPAFYSHNPALSGTSAYGPLRKSMQIHVEAAAGANSGTNQIATQDPDVIAMLSDAVKEGMLTKIGVLV